MNRGRKIGIKNKPIPKTKFYTKTLYVMEKSILALDEIINYCKLSQIQKEFLNGLKQEYIDLIASAPTTSANSTTSITNNKTEE